MKCCDYTESAPSCVIYHVEEMRHSLAENLLYI